MAGLPRLHVLTPPGLPDDATLRSVLESAGTVPGEGPRIALHLREPALPTRELWDRATTWLGWDMPGWVLHVNGRVDLAMALHLTRVHLPRRSFAVTDARSLLGPDALVGASVHDHREAAEALEQGADYLMAGSVFPTASHPGRKPLGLEGLEELVRLSARPVVAVGGVTTERVVRCRDAGAAGVAVIRGVWDAPDPEGAVRRYLSVGWEEEWAA